MDEKNVTLSSILHKTNILSYLYLFFRSIALVLFHLTLLKGSQCNHIKTVRFILFLSNIKGGQRNLPLMLKLILTCYIDKCFILESVF